MTRNFNNPVPKVELSVQELQCKTYTEAAAYIHSVLQEALRVSNQATARAVEAGEYTDSLIKDAVTQVLARIEAGANTARLVSEQEAQDRIIAFTEEVAEKRLPILRSYANQMTLDVKAELDKTRELVKATLDKCDETVREIRVCVEQMQDAMHAFKQGVAVGQCNAEEADAASQAATAASAAAAHQAQEAALAAQRSAQAAASAAADSTAVAQAAAEITLLPGRAARHIIDVEETKARAKVLAERLREANK